MMSLLKLRVPYLVSQSIRDWPARTLLLTVLLPLSVLADFLPAIPIAVTTPDPNHRISRVVFGSCANPTRDMSIFKTMSQAQPDLFLYIGDNVYAESEADDPDLKSLKAAYRTLADNQAFSALVSSVPTMVSWDDHDYGLNDAGGDWSHKASSEALYEHVWSANDERSDRDGIYYAAISGPPGQRVQVIMLDTRYFRTPLKKSRKKLDNGRYQPQKGRRHEILGETQWQWLEQQLQLKADVRLVVSSIQLLASGHNWEAWHLYPEERERFFDLVRTTRAGGVVLLSGDRHSSALYATTVGQVPLLEVTSSSLNVPLSSFVSNIKTEPGPLRIGTPYYDANFGVIDIDWQSRTLILQIRDTQSRTVRATTVSLDTLSFH